jgi:hypothetical protein
VAQLAQFVALSLPAGHALKLRALLAMLALELFWPGAAAAVA